MKKEVSIFLSQLRELSRSDYSQLPESSGVYFFLDAQGELLYVGKALSLQNRVGSYFRKSADLMPRTAQMVSQISSIRYLPVESEIDAFLLEANLIKKYKPKYNVSLKDGKNYPYICITAKDKIPVVSLARREENPKALYFGPYPPKSDTRGLLSFLRRIFPYVSAKHPGNKPCLRSHLGLCPCPGVFTDPEAQKQYRKNLRGLRLFLSGKRRQVQRELVAEMNVAARKLDFETAGAIKWKLSQIEYMTQARLKPWEYEENPNLREDTRSGEIDGLISRIPGTKRSDPFRLECFDISNVSGRLATASLVVSTNGEPDKKWYRHFRIRKERSDDFSAMEEAISRRLKHEDWPLPNILIVDGGKGQITAALKALSKFKFSLPVIGLAKREEEIYLSDGTILKLKRSDPALQIVQRLRDEAHRFSRRYHFILRDRDMLKLI